MAPDPDWLELCRSAVGKVRAMVAQRSSEELRAYTGDRGEGGDMTLEIDAGAERIVLAELEATGVGLTVISEEVGQLDYAGGGTRVVIDPIDGSLNAKRRIHGASLSIAVAEGPAMADVVFGYVAELGDGGREWWARRGEGAWEGDARLGTLSDGEIEVLGIESADPRIVAAATELLKEGGIHRLRIIGAIATTLCQVASGRFDAMASLWPCRSVDAAAAQLIVREAGGAVVLPDTADEQLGADLGLDMRSRVMAARGPEALAKLHGMLG